LTREVENTITIGDRTHNSIAQTREAAGSIELFWLRPVGSAWGLTDDLRMLLVEFRALMRKAYGADVSIESVLLVPSSIKADRPSRFNRVFESGKVFPPGVISPAIEILLIRDVAAVVTLSVRIAEDTNVWIGRVTRNADDLIRIEQRLKLKESMAAEVLWLPSKTQVAEA
jgi:energy-converting hydrogenase Eha subunit A